VASGAASGEVTVVNGNHSHGDHQPDDIYCSCTPSATGPASKSHHQHHHHQQPSSSSSGLNNNSVKPLSPYLVSVATSPRKKHTKTVMTSHGISETTKTLPPLDINRTILHHHSTRRSARKSSRGHTVPVMLATKSSIVSSPSKRSHSAASTQEEAQTPVPDTPESHNGRRSRGHRGHSSSPERKSSKVLCTPEKMSRRGHILNKIETVRILRARPAFYPLKDKISSASSKSSAKSVREYIDGATAASTVSPRDYMDLPHNILGKHITLRLDRSELKRKRGRGGLASIPPPTHLT
jgi:hypothetical protein